MNPRHPFLVIDQNQFRDQKAISAALDRCCRENLRLLITDVAGFEWSAVRNPSVTWQRALSWIAPFSELVVCSRKLAAMMREERQTGMACTILVDDGATGMMRDLLGDLAGGKREPLRSVLDKLGEEPMRRSREIWDNHDVHKAQVCKVVELLGQAIAPDVLADCRRSPENGFSYMLAQPHALAFVFQGLKQQVGDDSTAMALATQDSVSSGFLSAMYAEALYWLIFRGIESIRPRAITNDLQDWEYIIIGAISKGLLTVDSRAMSIYDAVRAGYAFRSRMSG